MVCLISVGILSSDNMLSKYLKLLCWYSMSILVIIPTLVAQIQLKLDTVTIFGKDKQTLSESAGRVQNGL